jgi:hypothetical protein
LPPKDENAINALIAKTDEAEAASGLEQIVDQYKLAIVEINRASRRSVQLVWQYPKAGIRRKTNTR